MKPCRMVAFERNLIRKWKSYNSVWINFFKFGLVFVEKELNYKEQIDRAKAIQAIDDDDEIDEDAEFFPSHFRSSTKSKKKLSDANETGKKVSFVATSVNAKNITSQTRKIMHRSFCTVASLSA